MSVKFLLEDGIELSRYKQEKLIANYNDKGLVILEEGLYVKSIQAIHNGANDARSETTTIIIIGKTSV